MELADNKTTVSLSTAVSLSLNAIEEKKIVTTSNSVRHEKKEMFLLMYKELPIAAVLLCFLWFLETIPGNLLPNIVSECDEKQRKYFSVTRKIKENTL